MVKQKIKVSAVSYLNTLPFLNGLESANLLEELEISLDIPSDCAEKLISGKVDLGLVPVAILPQMEEYHVVSDYCIGAKGKVDSVALFSDVPLDEIESIYLDYQSKTSVNLVKVLAKEYWGISPKWINASAGYESEIAGKTAGVIIGDRTFSLARNYAFTYDLAEEWLKHTGLPFVFACWVSNKELPAVFLEKFNAALKNGVEHIEEVIANYDGQQISKSALAVYLTQRISYPLNDQKKKAIPRFLDAMAALEPVTA